MANADHISILNRKISLPWFIGNLIMIGTTAILLLLRQEIPDVVFAVLCLVLNMFTIWFARNNTYTLIIAIVIAYYNYSFCMANYISVITTTYFTGYAGTAIGSQGLHILFLFNVLLYFVFFALRQPQKATVPYSMVKGNKYNPTFVVILCILLVFIWVFGFARPEQTGQRGAPSTYFEYSLILLILGFYYSGKSRLLQWILVGIGFAYAGLNFVYGGRATGVQVLICLFLCTIIDRIPRKWIVVGGIGLFFLMSLIGSMRTSFSLSADAMGQVWDELARTKFANDTAYSAYFTSMTFLDFIGMCSWGTRLAYFGNYLLSIFAGGLVPESNLPQVTRQYYVHYFGGVLPYYFYFYLGIAGLFLIALYLYWLLHKIISRTSTVPVKGIWNCIGIYVTSTVLRWYVYSPSQIIRGVLLLTVAFWILYLIDRYVRKKTTG